MESGDGPLSGCIVLLVFIVFNSILYGFGSAIQHLNESEIEKKADKIYKKQTLTGKVNRGYTNFSILEKACENYIAK